MQSRLRVSAPFLLTVAALIAPAGAIAQQSEEEIRALFEYDMSAPLDIAEQGTETHDGYTVLDFTYASPLGGRVPAYLYTPTGDGPHAGIVLMHGMPGSRDRMRSFAAGYAQAGAVVLQISAPWARPDGPRRNPVTFTPQDRDEQIQLIIDLRRGVDLLQNRPDVDPDRIGYVGASYGGAMGGLLAGMEHRIKAYVLMVGDGGLVAHFTGAEDAGRDLYRLSEERQQAWIAAMEPIEPIRWVGHAAPSPLLFQNGRRDNMVPLRDGRAYQEAGSDPKDVMWYDSGHRLPDQAIEDQVRWLARWIGVDPDRFGG